MEHVLTINLNTPEMICLDGPRRHLRITEKLIDAGFVFEPVDDLPPTSLELSQPWSLTQTDDGSAVVYRQG